MKSRGLFDHVNHIREVKDPVYYSSLSEEERKSFNKYMIIRVLSMDLNLIEEMAFVSKYFQVIPDEQFYKILIDIVPKKKKFCKYIKKSNGTVNKTLLTCICNKFEIGEKDAIDYFNLLKTTESGINELIQIIRGYGYNDSDIEKMFE